MDSTVGVNESNTLCIVEKNNSIHTLSRKLHKLLPQKVNFRISYQTFFNILIKSELIRKTITLRNY